VNAEAVDPAGSFRHEISLACRITYHVYSNIMVLEKGLYWASRVRSGRRPELTFGSLSGQVVEFSGWRPTALITLSAGLMRACLKNRRECAWILCGPENEHSLFYPPDLASAGIDVERIPILPADSAARAFGLAERLLRSGAFGMIVLDLTLHHSIRSRLVGRVNALARSHESLVLCLTRRPPGQPSLDPMVFIHYHMESRRDDAGRFRASWHLRKDKQGVPGQRGEGLYEPPPGLC